MRVIREDQTLSEGPVPYLSGQPEPLFALLDAARDPGVLDLLRSSELEHRSLYQGAQGDRLAACAPYLVQLEGGAPRIGALVEQSWGRAWGIFLTSDAGIEEVRGHCRRFLFVDDADDRELYFRFYDPRVLRAFLPTCSIRQNAALFSRVTRFVIEGEEPGTDVTFTRQERGEPVNRRLRIEPAQMAALADATEREFQERTIAFLREVFPGARGLPGAELASLVHAQVARARGYGLETEQHIVTYVTAAWQLGADFDARFPAARATLLAKSLTATSKSRWLIQWSERMLAGTRSPSEEVQDG